MFLQVDGMHSATCEAFLESIAEDCEGVTTAAASYVTEMVRVEYDPGSISERDLRDALSTVGYTATLRDEGGDTSMAAVGHSGTQGGVEERAIDELLGFRYAVGVIFGAFMLLPYVVMLYPAQLVPFFDGDTSDMFAGAGIGSGDGLLILPVFLVLTGIVLVFTGMPLLRGAYVSLKMRRPNTDLLVAVTVVSAYVSSTVAFLLGRIDVYYDLTIVVTASVVAAIYYESLAKQRAMDRLTDLTVSQVSEARRYEDGTTEPVDVAELEPGDRVLVRQGERIPVDGVLAEDECTVDEAVVTGESLPVLKRAGDDVVGGSVVTNGAAVVTVRDGATSSIDRLVTTVWNLQSADHGIQRRADRLTSFVLPGIVGVAVLAGVGSLVVGTGVPAAFLTMSTVLLVGCPWALGLATPLSVASSIEDAMERGIIVFDETVFERLRNVDTVVFDKTGTITTGRMDVLDADAPADLLGVVADLERRASHPAADAIVTAFARGERDTDGTPRADGGVRDGNERERTDDIGEFVSHATGVEGSIDETRVLVGTPDLFADRDWTVDADIETRATEAREAGRLPVVVGRDGRAEGIIVVGDEPRDEWEETLSRLRDRDIELVVLTGDDAAATDFLADHPAVDHAFAGVPPAGKTAAVRRLQAEGQVTMVGDGTNDAPALAQADLGISLGGGTALASDAADIAIVDDDLAAVETTFDLAHAARRRLEQNNGLALLYNGITIPLAVVGLLNPLFAMAAVVVSGGLLAANSFRDLLD